MKFDKHNVLNWCENEMFDPLTHQPIDHHRQVFVPADKQTFLCYDVLSIAEHIVRHKNKPTIDFPMDEKLTDEIDRKLRSLQFAHRDIYCFLKPQNTDITEDVCFPDCGPPDLIINPEHIAQRMSLHMMLERTFNHSRTPDCHVQITDSTEDGEQHTNVSFVGEWVYLDPAELKALPKNL
jgi:hypothetical protein